MSTLSELLAHGATAISDYNAALAAFKAAYCNLAAIDRTLANDNIPGDFIASFGPARPDVIAFRHPVANPNEGDDWEQTINAAVHVRLAAFPTPDPE